MLDYFSNENSLDELIASLTNADISSQFTTHFIVQNFAEKALTSLRVALASSGNVRYWSAVALGLLGDEKAFEPLVEALECGQVIVSKEAAKALAVLGGEEVIIPLIKALKNERRTIRLAAVEALNKVGDTHALEALQWLAQNEIVYFKDGSSSVEISAKQTIQHLSNKHHSTDR